MKYLINNFLEHKIIFGPYYVWQGNWTKIYPYKGVPVSRIFSWTKIWVSVVKLHWQTVLVKVLLGLVHSNFIDKCLGVQVTVVPQSLFLQGMTLQFVAVQALTATNKSGPLFLPFFSFSMVNIDHGGEAWIKK